MKRRVCITHSIELVQTGPSLILTFLCCNLLKFQNKAWSGLDQLNGGCDAPPNFPLVPVAIENLPLTQVYCHQHQ